MSATSSRPVELDVRLPVWERFFTVAPLVLIGTREADGSFDLAPKHMVLPLGWQNYIGFVCTPRHACRSSHGRVVGLISTARAPQRSARWVA